eukprot:scaffold4856_cov309-Prasinococcus_capsulatus_cf.AAC.2
MHDPPPPHADDRGAPRDVRATAVLHHFLRCCAVRHVAARKSGCRVARCLAHAENVGPQTCMAPDAAMLCTVCKTGFCSERCYREHQGRAWGAGPVPARNPCLAKGLLLQRVDESATDTRATSRALHKCPVAARDRGPSASA